MRRKSLLLLLLLALGAPWAARAQQTLLTENFDAMSSIPTVYSADGWYVYNASTDNTGKYWKLTTSNPKSSPNCVQYMYSSTYAADCYLVSAPFTLSSNSLELGVSVYERVGMSSYAETFEVFFVKASEVTDLAAVATATQYSAIASASYTNTNYAEQTGSIISSTLAGQSVRVVFYCTSLKDKYFLNIDDITVTETLAPTDPYVVLDPATETVFIGFTTTLTAIYGNVTGTPTITYTSSNEDVATVTGEGTTATVRGVATGTATITATLNYQGTDYTATAAITVEEPSYCTPSFSYTSTNYGLYIMAFATNGGLTNISNSSSLTSGGYADYYNSKSASIEAGGELSFTVSPGYSNPVGYAIWIDYNKDYEFGTDERVAATTSSLTSDWTGGFIVPATISEGDYRMRVMLEYDTNPNNPCINATYGEAEDYKLTVLPAPDCIKPTGIIATSITHESAEVAWNAGTATQWNLQYKKVHDNTWTMVNGLTAANYPMENLDPATSYELQVQADCGSNGTTEWVAFLFTTTCLAEDMCELSYELQAKAYSNSYGGDYYYGWYNAGIKVYDANSDEELAFWTVPAFEDGDGQASGTFAVCDGRELRFEWYSPYGYEETFVDSWTIYDRNGEEIVSGTGAMTDAVPYTMDCTEATCLKPTQITVEPSYTTATMTWEGTSDSYNVRYRTAPVTFYDGFEYGLDQWTIYHFGDENTNTYWQTQAANSNYVSHSGQNTVISRSYYGGAYNVDNWLITPQVTLEGTLKFWVKGTSSWPENYAIYVSTTGNAVEDFGNDPFYEPPTITDNWVEIEVDLSSFNGAQGYIAIRDNSNNQDYMLIDDFAIYGDESAAGAWVNRSTTSTSIELDELEMYTMYEYQLQSVCGEETTDWTKAAVFQTLNGNEKQFLNDGLWDVAANWLPEGVPTANQNVHIHAAATIPAGCIAEASTVTMETGGTLLIQDGAQLQFASGNVTATVEKEILGYGANEDNWQLISTPGGAINPTNVENMLEGDYDLFKFDGTEELEWRNYKQETFTMSNGLGYLYANKENTTLSFTTTLYTPAFYYAGGSNNYLINTDAEFGTFNLLGNCYMRNGYLMYFKNNERTDITDFYVMNEAGTEIVPNTNPYLAPMQGAFVQAAEDNQLVLIAVQPWSREEESSPVLSMAVSQGNASVDQAMLRFGHGSNLEKFQLNPKHTKVFMPVESKNYAVVYTEENVGEMPVNFKAEKNGTYTLSFTTEEVSFSYLHLIDNKTGNNVNLLETPSYTFDARTTDYASRFKLVFATGNNSSDDAFAYFSNGNFVINNDGEATLQVVDVMGRIIKSETINGCADLNVNAPAGVYMLRLINGSDVKVQKVIVR